MKNPLREHLRLSVIEIKRIVNRKQFLLAVVVVLLLVYYELFSSGPWGHPAGFYGVVVTASAHREIYNCFVAALGGAAALAVDTETGFLGLALSRNIRRWHHILHKVIATCVVITAMTFVRYALLVLVGAFVLPWDVPALGDCIRYDIEPLGGMYCVESLPTPLERALGPFPALFLTHPVLNDLIAVVMIAAGTSVMALLGIFAAACGANGFVAMSIPVVVTFTFRIMLSNILPRWIDPTGLVDIFWGYYKFNLGAQYWPWVWLAAWLGWSGALIGLSMYIAEKRELATKADTE